MKHTIVRAAAVALLSFAAVVAASADVPNPNGGERPRPRPPASDPSVVDVVIESGDTDEALVYLPTERPGAPSALGPVGPSPASTAVAGAALSLALMTGGLWLVRSRRKLGARATAGAAAVLCVIGGTAVYGLANIAPPRRPVDPGTLLKAVSSGEALRGKAHAYYGAEPGVVRIVLPNERHR